jgi:copper homeostasis protein
VKPLTIEVIVSSVEDAVEAARGGAHRLEVVRDLGHGGLTPSIALVRQIQREVALPLRGMVRESGGFACSSGDECRAVLDHASALDALGVDGIVIGWTRATAIDEETLGTVLDAARSSRATFHRAFDALPDSESALQVLQRYQQIDRVLTDGGPGTWPSRCATLARYARWAGPRITILPCGGVDEAALRALASCGAVTEAHVGRAARRGYAVDGPVSSEQVRTLRRAAGWDR